MQLLHHAGDEGRCHGAGDHVQLLGAVDPVGLVQLRQKFFLKQAHHAHAVFQLVVVLVERCRRDGAACLKVPFIAGVDDALAVAALAFITEFFHNVDDLSAGLCIVGHLRVQIFAVIRNAAGHGCNALHHGGQLQQVGKGAAQLVAVVHAAAKHQLTVDGNAALHQTGQVLEHLAAALIGQHPHPQLGVGGVHRDIDRRDVHLDDAVDLVILHIGHSDVVTEQKAQPLVIILEIQALAHTRGQLVDEAEHTVVGAGMLCIAQIGLEPAAKGAALRPLHLPLPDAVRYPGFQVEAAAVGIKIVVQRVVQLVVVHAQQLVTGGKAKSLGLAAGIHLLDPYRHLHPPPLKHKKGKALRPPLLYITPLCHQLRAN